MNLRDVLLLCWRIIVPATVSAALYLLWKWSAPRTSTFPMADGFKPIAGHLLEFIRNFDRFHDWRTEQIQKHESKGGVVAFSAFNQALHLFISDPQLIKFVFETKFDHLTRGVPRDREKSQEMFGQGIFQANKEGWKFQRKLASQILGMKNLRERVFYSFLNASERMVKKLRELSGFRGDSPQEIDLYDMFMRTTMDAFVDACFGVKSSSIESAPRETRFAEAFSRGLLATLGRITSRPFWKLEKWFDVGDEKQLRIDSTYLRNFVDNVVRNHQQGRHDDSNDLLSLFLQAHPNASAESIQDVCLNFIIAGRDTTGALMSWFIYEMMENPHICEKVYDEIMGVSEPTFENVQNMSYLESALLETLRLHPSVPSVMGMPVIQPIVLPDGRVIPSNSVVEICTYAQGRSPTRHPNPSKFDPSRFADGIRSFDTCDFSVFNVRPRMCIGRAMALMEAKICLWHLFRAFRFEKTPECVVEYQVNLILAMKYGLKVFLTPRE